MKLQDVVTLLEKKLSNLTTIRQLSVSTGDVERVIQLDEEIADTQMTLSVLKSQAPH